MAFTDIPINKETDDLLAKNATKGKARDGLLDAVLTKWVTHAEANNLQAGKLVEAARDKAQKAVNDLEKKLEAIKAATKKKGSADFKLLLEFKGLRKQVADLSSEAKKALADLYEPMKDYRGNGWIKSAREGYTDPLMVERFIKMRKEGMKGNTVTASLSFRLGEYEDRAALLMDEAGDLLLKSIEDAKEKEAKIKERVTDLLAQVEERSTKLDDTIHKASTKNESMDSYLAMKPESDSNADILENYFGEVEAQTKRANGSNKTLGMQCDHILALTKGLEKVFAAEIKKAKEAAKAHDKRIADCEKIVKAYRPKVEAYRKAVKK